MPTRNEPKIKLEKSKEIAVLDRRIFKVCEINEREFGPKKKKSLFIHFDGKTWNLLLVNPNFSLVKYYKLE